MQWVTEPTHHRHGSLQVDKVESVDGPGGARRLHCRGEGVAGVGIPAHLQHPCDVHSGGRFSDPPERVGDAEGLELARGHGGESSGAIRGTGPGGENADAEAVPMRLGDGPASHRVGTQTDSDHVRDLRSITGGRGDPGCHVVHIAGAILHGDDAMPIECGSQQGPSRGAGGSRSMGEKDGHQRSVADGVSRASGVV